MSKSHAFLMMSTISSCSFNVAKHVLCNSAIRYFPSLLWIYFFLTCIRLWVFRTKECCYSSDRSWLMIQPSITNTHVARLFILFWLDILKCGFNNPKRRLISNLPIGTKADICHGFLFFKHHWHDFILSVIRELTTFYGNGTNIERTFSFKFHNRFLHYRISITIENVNYRIFAD